MAEEIHHPDGRIEHPSVRHERRDLNFGCICSLLLGAMGFAAVVHYVVWLFFLRYTAYENVVHRSPYPLAPTPSLKLPPEPRLDPLNMKEQIARGNVYVRQGNNEQILSTVGHTAEPGFVHIPIERAMDLLAGKLPVAAQPPAELSRRSNGLLDSGGPNSGRVLRDVPLWYEH